MAQIPDHIINQLRDAGLFVDQYFGSDHTSFPDGVVIAKPVSVAGNDVPGFDCQFGDSEMRVGPALFFHRAGAKWIVTSHDFVPGPGPGDFVNAWDTPEQAVADILDFYFGDPVRMAIKAMLFSRR
jgi:hypothetical protein